MIESESRRKIVACELQDTRAKLFRHWKKNARWPFGVNFYRCFVLREDPSILSCCETHMVKYRTLSSFLCCNQPREPMNDVSLYLTGKINSISLGMWLLTPILHIFLKDGLNRVTTTLIRDVKYPLFTFTKWYNSPPWCFFGWVYFKRFLRGGSHSIVSIKSDDFT